MKLFTVRITRFSFWNEMKLLEGDVYVRIMPESHHNVQDSDLSYQGQLGEGTEGPRGRGQGG